MQEHLSNTARWPSMLFLGDKYIIYIDNVNNWLKSARVRYSQGETTYSVADFHGSGSQHSVSEVIWSQSVLVTEYVHYLG